MTRNVIELHYEQGSPEWLANRRTTFNASELAAAMGIHPNIIRNELIRLYARGTEIEYSDYVKNVIFPNGHRVEKIIRVLAEKNFDEDFIPKVFALDGKYSCSLDGQTIIGDRNLEIKQYAKELYESVANGILPDHHKPQVQQGLWITGAELTIFAVSSEDEQSFVSMEVFPDHAFIDTIPRIWAKFKEDYENYTDIEQVSFLSDVEKDDRLPVVKLSSGGISVASNIKAWFSVKKQAFEKLPEIIDAESIGEFQTTKDNFEVALPLIQHLRKGLEENAKPLVDVIDELISIEKYLKKCVSHCSNTLTEFRRSIRQKACDEATEDFWAYVEQKNQGFPVRIDVLVPDFMACCNRTKNHDSLGSAIGAELMNAKIEVDKIAEVLHEKITWYSSVADGCQHLFSDLQEIIYKDDEHFMLLVTTRIEQHKKAEADRLTAKREQDEAEKMMADVHNASPIPDQAPPLAQPAAQQEQIQEPIQEQPAEKVIAASNDESPIPQRGEPTLKLGDINSRLGFTVTCDFLGSLGFDAHSVGAKKLYHEDDFPLICGAIVKHIEKLI